MVKNQLNNESTEGSHFAFKKRLIVPHCILVCIRLNLLNRNVKETLLDMTGCWRGTEEEVLFIYLADAFCPAVVVQN